jgi:hypothetical protein
VPLREIKHPTMKKGRRPKISERPPDRGRATAVDMLYAVRIQL